MLKNFKGKRFIFLKLKWSLEVFGARMSEAQKKQIQSRLKNRLQKTYILNFNKEKSVFNEDEKIDAISGATDSWGDNFSRGEQYKNVKQKTLVQTQEFYGKKFLVKDKLAAIQWKMGTESKSIGQYMCFKATASIPTDELEWYNFSWGDLRETNTEVKTDSIAVEIKDLEIKTTEVEAWYTLQIPVSHGPGEYWGTSWSYFRGKCG